MAMTEAQFDAIVKLMRGTRDCGANRAARRVLVDGFTQAEAMRENDITRATVSNAVRRYQEADALIRSAYCPKPRQSTRKAQEIVQRDVDPETMAAYEEFNKRTSGPLTDAAIGTNMMLDSNRLTDE